jgi:hypothetical protein
MPAKQHMRVTFYDNKSKMCSVLKLGVHDMTGSILCHRLRPSW